MINRLFWRLSIPLMLLVGMGMLLLGYASLTQTRLSLTNTLQEAAFTQTRLIAILLEERIGPESSPDQIQAALSQAAGLSPEAYLSIFSADGGMIASTQPIFGDIPSINQPEIQQAILTGEGSQMRPLAPDTDEKRLFIGRMIEIGNDKSAILQASFPITALESDLSQIQYTWILAGILAIVSAAGLSYGVSIWLSQPLRSLNHAAEKMLQGESVESQPAAQDEFARLSRNYLALIQQAQDTSTDLLSEQRKLSTILDSITEGIIIVDQKGLIRVINQSICELFQLPAEEALNRSLAEVLRDYRLVQLWEDSLQTQKIQVALLDFRKPNLYLQCSALPLESTPDDGLTLLIFLDLTRLQRLETVRKDFVSNISHELRTPLASLKALTETLLEGALEDPPAAKRFINRINIEVDALSQMVAELLELSRIESGRVPLELRPIHPRELLLPAFDRMAVQAERKEVQIVVNCPDELTAVLADPPRMQQVLVNLIHNAIKFSNPGGEITLSAWQNGEQVLFSVHDTGVGIPAEDLPRIFERFFKSDRARSGGGTGLGLAISRHLVEAHGGRIWAESVETRGSTFTFSLPAAH